jgi:hypothetical protein
LQHWLAQRNIHTGVTAALIAYSSRYVDLIGLGQPGYVYAYLTLLVVISGGGEATV